MTTPCKTAAQPWRRTAALRRLAVQWGAVMVLSGLLLVACGGADDEDAVAAGAPVPQGAPKLAVAGKELYQANCASCHGADLRGTGQGPPHLDEIYAPDHHPDEAFLSASRLGAAQHHWDFGPMPAIQGLSDDDLRAIVAYVRAVQRAEGIE